MLSDEEKKAMESLIEIREFANLSSYKDTKINQLNSIDVVLNLIEKQSKEIEELKAKNKILEAISLSFNEIQDRDKKWKDKIKAKIEEVEQWELYNMKIPRLSTLDERLGAKIGIKYVLQSLLEEE